MPELTDKEKIDALWFIMGDATTPPVLASGGTPPTTINGRLQWKESDWQIHNALDGLVGTPTTEGTIPTMQRQIAEQAEKIRLLELNPPGSVEVPPVSPVPIPAGDWRAALTAAGIVFASDGTISGFKLITKGAPEGDYYGYVGVNDGALRLFAGIREKIGGAWPSVDKNPNLPIIMHAYERDGGISWDFEPPLLASDPNPRPFKTWLMYFAGFVRGIGPRSKANVGKFIDFCTFEQGRGVRFSTRRLGSTTPDIDTALQLDAENANAVAIRVNGQLRRIMVDGGGGLIVGEVVDEGQ